MIPEDLIRAKIANEENFIAIKRFNYSLERMLERYPDGVPDRIIAQALLIKEEDVEELYQKIILKLKKGMKIE
jgi:hypothetical protein